MTTTPTIWKSDLFANSTGHGGFQTSVQSIGLTNGNILVMWEDDTNGPSAGLDIMGQIFTPEGLPASAVFQVNSAVVVSDETGPQVVALPDGGYVVAYGSYLEALGGFLAIQRYDSAGNSVSSKFILDDLSSITAWCITADTTGNYTVTFERKIFAVVGTEVESSRDIHAITYDFVTNLEGPERINVAQNSIDEHDGLGATATFANGNILTLYDELDRSTVFNDPLRSIEFTITNPFTGEIVRQATEIRESPEDALGRALDAAVLKGGQFVMLYSICPIEDDIFGFHIAPEQLMMKIGTSGSSGASIGREIVIDDYYGWVSEGQPDDGPRGYENAKVIGLKDGGFVVVWLALGEGGQTLMAARYGATGTAIGDSLVVTTDVTKNDNMLGELSLTSDGRVLVSYLNGNHDVAEIILDTRDNEIRGTGSGEVITTQTTSTRIWGLGGNDTILGQGGDDDISGGKGIDTLHGGKGDDTYYLWDTTFDGDHDVVVEAADGGNDKVHVRGDSILLLSYTLAANVERAIVNGVEGFDLYGNNLDNRLLGNSAVNFFFGFGGADFLRGDGGGDALFGGNGGDRLNGGSQADTLTGNLGNDTYELFDTTPTGVGGARVYDTVIESAGGGNDTVILFADASPSEYVLGENIENGIVRGISSFNLRGNVEDNLLEGNGAINQLLGLSGDDTLTGGEGGDALTGGSGQDRFTYLSVNDSGLVEGARDIIRDLGSGEVIDVRAIDANGLLAGDQSFVIDVNNVSTMGEISFQIVAAGVLVNFNVDGDATAEMQILVLDRGRLDAADFIL